MKLNSVFAESLSKHIEAKRRTLTKNYVRNIVSALTSFDSYCIEAGHSSEELTESIIGRWLSQQSHKGRHLLKLHRTAIRQFALYLLENEKPAYVLPYRSPEPQPAETGFRSCLSGFIEGLVESKRARGYKYGHLNEYGILKRLDAFCINEGLEGEGLPRWLVEKWSERTAGEGSKSRSNRIVVIRQLALYMVAQGGNAYIAEAAPVPRNPFPYVPDEDELAALLVEIDSQTNRNPWSNRTFPVLFRLLLASGLRISEACSLKAGCIDLHPGDYCTIDVISAKGHRDRRLFLSGDILAILRGYDAKMTAMMPGRLWFFPGDYRPFDEHISASTARKRFNIARRVVYNGNPVRRPTVHSLRHAYIILTIRRWRAEGLDVEEMLPYLSRHLGHSSIQETFTYYDHHSRDYDHVRSDAEYFNAIVPEVRHER